MPRGRPKKSLQEHVRDGTYRPDRHGPLPAKNGGENAAKMPPAVKNPEPLPPAAGGQAELWAELNRLLSGVVTERDVPILTELCWWWAELRRVQAQLRGMTPGEKGYKDTLIGAGICSTNLDRLASRFGLTPADRAKLRVENPGPPQAKTPTRPKTKLDRQGPPA